MSEPGGAAVRVMVVDDHPMWREAVARDLTEAGFDVVAAVGDGGQALRVLAAVRPDVVVLDLQLPDVPGVTVTRGILAALPAARVLILSASAEQQDVLDAVKAGAAGYIVKCEAEILRMVATGLSYRQIAERLVLSHRTVQNHVQNTLTKLHLHNRVELTRYAIEHGLDSAG